jgi:hypothetical protein
VNKLFKLGTVFQYLDPPGPFSKVVLVERITEISEFKISTLVLVY